MHRHMVYRGCMETSCARPSFKCSGAVVLGLVRSGSKGLLRRFLWSEPSSSEEQILKPTDSGTSKGKRYAGMERQNTDH